MSARGRDQTDATGRYRPDIEGPPALSDTDHSWQVAAGEGGTCTRGLRTFRPEHAMFAALDSSPRVCLGPTTNTQGVPPNRLPILASQGPRMHVPSTNVLRGEGDL